MFVTVPVAATWENGLGVASAEDGEAVFPGAASAGDAPKRAPASRTASAAETLILMIPLSSCAVDQFFLCVPM
jgi:hypothetical protein